MQLSPFIRSALESVTEQSGITALKKAAAEVSARYRDATCANAQIRNEDEARAYLATRFPATYAAARSVFAQMLRVRPDFMPQSILDVGAGPGTVALAALEIWPDIARVDLLEPNRFLREAGSSLFSAMEVQAEINWINGDVRNFQPQAQNYDLVAAGYMLNEAARSGDIEAISQKLWTASRDALVLIEPGTPAGNGFVIAARAHLLKGDAAIVAPCPHSERCPLTGSAAWCHFSVRVERSRLHRALKDGALGYEDEKFSYIALSREKVELPMRRVIGHPSGSKVVQVQVCNKTGTAETAQIAKSHDDYKAARKLSWGDAF
ncbi:MAG: small ribosomal subunit Rsm22 family protein [Micavibrio sp.]